MLKPVISQHLQGRTEISAHIRIDQGFVWRPQSKKAGCAYQQQGERDVNDACEKRHRTATSRTRSLPRSTWPARLQCDRSWPLHSRRVQTCLAENDQSSVHQVGTRFEQFFNLLAIEFPVSLRVQAEDDPAIRGQAPCQIVEQKVPVLWTPNTFRLIVIVEANHPGGDQIESATIKVRE